MKEQTPIFKPARLIPFIRVPLEFSGWINVGSILLLHDASCLLLKPVYPIQVLANSHFRLADVLPRFVDQMLDLCTINLCPSIDAPPWVLRALERFPQRTGLCHVRMLSIAPGLPYLHQQASLQHTGPFYESLPCWDILGALSSVARGKEELSLRALASAQACQ
ncbi:hypothetical protein PENSPDRAFT_16706 [Peniophora sp. CONT]|nr:hypothetical protein PENSPDRAFT_16706 [Peniophora sp. CONT]